MILYIGKSKHVQKKTSDPLDIKKKTLDTPMQIVQHKLAHSSPLRRIYAGNVYHGYNFL